MGRARSLVLMLVVLVCCGASPLADADADLVPDAELVPAADAVDHGLAVAVARGGTEPAIVALRSVDERDAVVRALEGTGASIVRTFDALPVLAVEVSARAIDALEASPAVVAVEPDILLHTQLAESGAIVGAPGAHGTGQDGSGRTVAIVDSGVETNHPFLGGRVIAGACFSHGDCPNGEDTQLGVAAGIRCFWDVGDCYHGTHVAGIAAGATYPGASLDADGIAPGASIMSIRIVSRIEGDGCSTLHCSAFHVSDLVAALDHVHDQLSTFDIAAVNVSLGAMADLGTGSNCDTVEQFAGLGVREAVERLRVAGVPTVVAAGNNDPVGIAFPACLSNVVAVGATNDTDAVASFSDSGPALDVLAPGVSIRSSYPAPSFETKSGTSMAAPHVSGAFAVLDDAAPSATLAQKRDAIVRSGPSITDRNGISRHRLSLATPLATTAPNTSMSQKPAATTTSASARFSFSSRPGSTFRCKLDGGAWTPCTSPRTVSVPTGTHTFRVAATSLMGVADPTPAVYTWHRVDPPTGYWMISARGDVYAFGDVHHHGSAARVTADLEPTPTGGGYWALATDGRVAGFGDAGHHGDATVGVAFPTGDRAAAIARTATGDGYWVFSAAGRVAAFGDARSYGDMRGVPLNGPVLDAVATPTGRGYFMVGSDGGVFTFGDARFAGSMGGIPLNAPVQSLVPDGDGSGYWLVALDGGIFAFGAPFRGSMGGIPLQAPVVGMVRFGNGYLMVGADGGIFNFSDRAFAGSLGGQSLPAPVVAVAASG